MSLNEILNISKIIKIGFSVLSNLTQDKAYAKFDETAIVKICNEITY